MRIIAKAQVSRYHHRRDKTLSWSVSGRVNCEGQQERGETGALSSLLFSLRRRKRWGQLMQAERVGWASRSQRCAENDDDAITRLSKPRGQQFFFDTLHHLLSSGQGFHNAWQGTPQEGNSALYFL